jgi:hypothetical protein
LGDYSYNAAIQAKKIKKETSRKTQPIIYGKSSLLDKIIASSLNENLANKRLEQISYSAINGQRQEVGNYQPEGVQMLGQMGREKPLTAITKEMIEEYQEEQNKPLMVDGEARKYMKADYEPQLSVPFENLKTTDEIDDIITRYRQGRTDISNEIANIDSEIKETNDNILTLKKEIDEKGSNFGNLFKYRTKLTNLEKLKQQRKQLEKEIDKYNYDLKNLDINRNEIIKQNALLNQANREEVMKFEQSLASVNRNRLNLQQQPYESEFEYYNRLKEIEKTKYDPTLYKKFASNETTKKLKTNLNELFSDVSFKEDILKNLNDEDKFMINKLFDKVGKAYLDQYGFNNTRLSPRMTAEALTNILNSVKGQEISPLQAIIKRNKQREIYADTIALARDRQDLEARQAAAAKLQARIKRQPQREIYADTIALARDRQGLEARQAEARQVAEAAAKLQARLKRQPQREIYADTIALARDRQDLEARRAEARQEAEAAATNIQRVMRGRFGRQQAAQQAGATAATNIQKIVRGNKGRIEAALLRNEKRIEARNARRENEAATAQQAATNIQRVMRGRTGRQQAREQANQQEEKETERISTNLINSVFQQLAKEEKENKAKQAKKAKELLSQFGNYQSMLQRQRLPKKSGEELSLFGDKEIEEFERKERLKQDLKNKALQQQLASREQYYKSPQYLKQASVQKYENPFSQTPYTQSMYAADTIKNIAKKYILKQKKQQQQQPVKLYQSTTENLDRITKKIEKAVESKKSKEEIEKLVQELQKQPIPTPAATALSSAMTVAEQREAGLRKTRSDLGSKRGPYKKKNTPEERRMQEQTEAQTGVQTRAQILQDALNRPGMKRLDDIAREVEIVEELLQPMAKTSAQKKGKGIRKPAKRQVKVSQEEKNKNRLRLVIAQIQAGNTNPKLIQEVNKLYKTLYNIDNAIMLIKK